MHQALGAGREGVTVLVQQRHRLHGHRVGDHVLDHETDRRQQRAQHEPRLHRHEPAHGIRVGEQADHDQQAGRGQARTEIDQPGLVPPDQVDQVPERHLQRPGDARPEPQRGKKLRREPEVVLDEKGADDRRQARHAIGHVDHQGRQIGKPELAPELQDRAVEPVVGACQHGEAGYWRRVVLTNACEKEKRGDTR